MAVTFAGAVSICVHKEENFTPMQRVINTVVAFAPNILGRFKQEPTITKSVSFTRDGVPLSDEEIVEQKATMVADVLRQFDHPFASMEERDGGPNLRHATMSYGANGKMETVLGDVVDRKGDSIKKILAISAETRASLSIAGINLDEVIQAIENDREPTKMASRVQRITYLLDNHDLPEDLTDQLHAKLHKFTNDIGSGFAAGCCSPCCGSFSDVSSAGEVPEAKVDALPSLIKTVKSTTPETLDFGKEVPPDYETGCNTCNSCFDGSAKMATENLDLTDLDFSDSDADRNENVPGNKGPFMK